MARIRNVSDDVLTLKAIGGPRPFEAVVKPDQTVDVPKDVFEAHEWPESLWHAVESRSKTDKEN